MPLKRNVMMPDFYPDEPQPWMDFPEDEPIDMGAAAGAFKQRFMQPRGDMGTGRTPMPTSLPEMDSGIDGGGGSPLKPKGLKSL